MTNTFQHIAWGLLATLSLGTAMGVEPATEQVTINIDEPMLSKALIQFTRQAGLQLIFPVDGTAADLPAPRLSGTFDTRVALDKLLHDSGLNYRFISPRTVAVYGAGAPEPTAADLTKAQLRLAQATQSETPAARAAQKRPAESVVNETGAIPEILVKDSKILNMDIKRSRDNAQPYIVFDREQLANSGAVNLEAFFKSRLTMNATAGGNMDRGAFIGNVSTVNLRGLGSNQTLILVDGRRLAPINEQGRTLQPNLNNIPMSAIERVEVLPTTASGIYGGGATGGVINVILRRDYVGAEAKLTYDNTFDGDATRRQVDVSSGFSFNDGRTDVMLTGSHFDQNLLRTGERDFAQAAREYFFSNNPAFYTASAFPPVGATPNIRSLDGSNLVLDDGRALNSPSTFVPVGYTGRNSDQGTALLLNAGRYNFAVGNTRTGYGANSALQGANTTQSGSLAVRHEFSSRVQGFIDFNASSIKTTSPLTYISSGTVSAAAPNNPFQQDIRVVAALTSGEADVVSKVDNGRLTGGLIVKLGAGWQAAADYTQERSSFTLRSANALTAAGDAAIANGTIDLIRDVNLNQPDLTAYLNPLISVVTVPFVSRSHDATLRLSGPVLSVPAGEITVSTLLESREVKMDDAAQFVSVERFFPSRSQSVESAYFELGVPLIGRAQNIPWARDLSLQLAARSDWYTTNGVTGTILVGSNTPIVRAEGKLDSVDPTVGLKWSPSESLTLRASYGTGFLPPTVNQILEQITVVPVTVMDPRRGGASTLLPIGSVVSGGSTRLEPEESESISLGFILTPVAIPRLRFSLDYSDIHKSKNIQTLTTQQIVDSESVLPNRVTRAAVAPGDPYGVGAIIGLDATLVNVADARMQAFDIALDYALPTLRLGEFTFFTTATRITRYDTQLLPTSPVLDNLGVNATYFDVNLKLKASGGISWKRDRLTLGWNTTYFDSYTAAPPYLASSAPDLLAQGNGGRVESQIFHDAFANYGLSDFGSPSLRNIELQLGITNVFNTRPAWDIRGSNGISGFGDSRMASYRISLKKIF